MYKHKIRQADGGPGAAGGAAFNLAGLNQLVAPSSGSLRLFSPPGAVGTGSPGLSSPYDNAGTGGMPGASPSSRQSTPSMMFGRGSGTPAGGGDGRRGSLDKGMGGWSGAALEASQGRGGGVIKGEMGGNRGGAGEEDPMRKRPRETWRWECRSGTRDSVMQWVVHLSDSFGVRCVSCSIPLASFLGKCSCCVFFGVSVAYHFREGLRYFMKSFVNLTSFVLLTSMESKISRAIRRACGPCCSV